MRRDPPSERAIWRDERGGFARSLQRLAQGQRDCLCLCRRGRQFGGTHIAQPPGFSGQRRPFAGEIGRRQRIGHGPPPHRPSIMPAAIAPGRHFGAVHPHPVQQQLELKLRMRLNRPAALAGGGIGRVRAQ